LKPNINSVEVHPQLSNNEHPVDDVLVGADSLWPLWACLHPYHQNLVKLYLKNTPHIRKMCIGIKNKG
jgi:hypothetical protein